MSSREYIQPNEYGDLILHDHWRLKDISIQDSHGEKEIKRGWNSVLQTDGTYNLVSENIDSSKTPYQTLILLVSPNLIGTHEATDPDHIPLKGEDKIGFEGIDFSSGWSGAPVAVACFPEIYISIYKSLVEHNRIGVLDGLTYGDMGVLDGHHRRRYAAEGPIKLKYIPVQIIPFIYDKSVVLDTWHSDGQVWTPQQVFECFKNPNKYADAKRTKFGVKGTDGITRRILSTQPNVKIPLVNLV